MGNGFTLDVSWVVVQERLQGLVGTAGGATQGDSVKPSVIVDIRTTVRRAREVRAGASVIEILRVDEMSR